MPETKTIMHLGVTYGWPVSQLCQLATAGIHGSDDYRTMSP